jgi:hypothetical protein
VELEALDSKLIDQERYKKLAGNLEEFLGRLRQSSARLDVEDRRRIVRLVIKEILVGPDKLTIKHSIPTSGSPEAPASRLCMRSHDSAYTIATFEFERILPYRRGWNDR